MSRISDKGKINIFINDIIKSISKDPFGEKVVYDGSVAVFKILLNLNKSNAIKERKLSILDMDLDIYEDVDKLWGKNLTKGQLRRSFFKYLNENIVSILKKSKYFTDVYLLETDLSSKKLPNSNHKLYIAQFNLHLEKEFLDDFGVSYTEKMKLPIDLVIVNNLIPFYKTKILLDNNTLDVNLYEIEKYFAGKILGALKHLDYYNKSKLENDQSHQIKTNYDKFVKDLNDITLLRELYEYNFEKIDYYVKILSNDSEINTTELFMELGKYMKG